MEGYFVGKVEADIFVNPSKDDFSGFDEDGQPTHVQILVACLSCR